MTDQIKLIYGKRRLAVDVGYNCRECLSITVHPDCRITAMAPQGFGLADIKMRLEKRRAWIARQVDFFEQFQPGQTARKYVSGETHYYLGRQYRLKVISGDKPKVRLVGRFFMVELPEKDDSNKVHMLMQEWYTAHAKDLLALRISLYWPIFKKGGVQEPRVHYRRLRKRWGSYSKNGRITLNTELVKAPIYCVDYVIVHELCHQVWSNHDRKYFQLLSSVLPDWKKRKERLEKAASELTVTT